MIEVRTMRDRRPSRSDVTGRTARTRRRAVEAARPVRAAPEIGLGERPCRILWCRIGSGSPGEPADERYYADEVRPTGVSLSGHMTWEAVPNGLTGIMVHNIAEAGAGTHCLAEGTVVRVEERLDRAAPPGFVYLTFASVPSAQDRLAKVVSYEAGAYTVQPVRRESGGFVNDGPPIAGVPNLGELWDDEQGYLAGPSGFDRYVRIVSTPAGWVIVLHPPRMV